MITEEVEAGVYSKLSSDYIFLDQRVNSIQPVIMIMCRQIKWTKR